jgi:hypothetical protein
MCSSFSPLPYWASPRIVEAALRNPNSLFVIDGEAVLLGLDVQATPGGG